MTWLKIMILVTVTCLLFCGVTQSAYADGGLDLVVNGHSRYVIVLPVNAIESERHAAEELQTYLQEMSGAKLAILDDAQPESATEIRLAGARASQTIAGNGS